MRKGLGQYNLARSAGMSKSKISKIQSQLRGAKHLDAPAPAAAPEADEIPF